MKKPTALNRRAARVSVVNRQRRVPVDVRLYRRWLRDLFSLTRRSSAIVGLTFVNDPDMRRINFRHRRINRTTDVLAFPSAGTPPRPKRTSGGGMRVLGDIVISIDTARRQAREAGATLRDECARLLIHGYLHLLGYDHERSRREAARMRRLARRLEARLTGPARRMP